MIVPMEQRHVQQVHQIEVECAISLLGNEKIFMKIPKKMHC